MVCSWKPRITEQNNHNGQLTTCYLIEVAVKIHLLDKTQAFYGYKML